METVPKDKLPRHLAIIMDGNGRWARARGLPRIAGHRKGAEAVRATVTACRKRGISALTLFSFSSQNWNRATGEVNALMSLLSEYIISERPTIMDNGIRLRAIGELDLLPPSPKKALLDLIEASSSNEKMTLCLALSYGGHEEIAHMARALASKAARGEINPGSIDVDMVGASLWSSFLGPVDLLIRTSGELRISNFLLWGLAYAELFFTNRMWPEFDEQLLEEALEEYGRRNRRFGNVT